MAELSIPAPEAVPEDLTIPSKSYKTQTWLAMGGLLSFVFLYLALTTWFGWTAYRLGKSAIHGGDGAIIGVLCAILPAFFAIFMLKALFFVRNREPSGTLEITAGDHPDLLAFIFEIADHIGAPRPHRVFLSPGVNACVFYDLSFLNLLFPSKKNLEIGMGLVNCMTMSEMQAVLAHEFGHFSQRTMAVGRWVGTAEQVASHLINERDIFDRFLQGLSRIDLRIAWIGWILQLIVWSIRSLLETAFRVVVLAQRALSREMEFHADLVAVSVSGSDALTNGLYRLQPADEDWDRVLNFANDELQKDRFVPDLYTVHTRISEHMARILDKPDYAKLPDPDPAIEAKDRRIFKPAMALPPRMWSTHPPSTEREENAKKRYVPAALNDRSAWTLFTNPDAVRAKVTALVFSGVEKNDKRTMPTLEESLEHLDKNYSRPHYAPHYRGVYLGRSLSRHAEAAAALYEGKIEPQALPEELASLYPESLSDELEQLANLHEEQIMLEGLQANQLTTPGDAIRHRGEELSRNQLPDMIKEIKRQIEVTEQQIAEHDRKCRAVHLGIARHLKGGWEYHLIGLIELLHYAEHTEANIRDAHGYMSNVVAISFADGHVSAKELERILAAAMTVHSAVVGVYSKADTVKLPPAVAASLEAKSWDDFLENCKLPQPCHENINEWMQAIDGWCMVTSGSLLDLRRAVLEHLLNTETQLADWLYEDGAPKRAPSPPPRAPSNYKPFRHGKERERQTKLNLWDSFMSATGLGAEIARFAVAAAIVGSVVFFGNDVGASKLTIHNGLERIVSVSIDGSNALLRPHQSKEISIGRAPLQIATRTKDGIDLESFTAEVDAGFAHYVYNVAGGAPLIEWTAIFGNAKERPPRYQGAPRWRSSGADYVLSDPPEQVSGSGDGGTRSVLGAFSDGAPSRVVAALGGRDVGWEDKVIATRARWDAADSEHVLTWLAMARDLQAYPEIIRGRLENNPQDVPALRAEIDSASPATKAEVRRRHLDLAESAPDNPSLQYIATRAMTDKLAQEKKFLALYGRWPDDKWISYATAYVYAGQEDWKKAEVLFQESMMTHPVTRMNAAMELWRIRRLQAALSNEPAELKELEAIPALESLFLLESAPAETEDLGPSFTAYICLREGELEKAAKLNGDMPETDDRLNVLIAASDTAPQRAQDAVLALPLNEKWDDITCIYLAALAVRNRKKPMPYLKQVTAHREEFGNRMTKLLKALYTSKEKTLDLSEFLRSSGPHERGIGYAAAAIVRGEKAPKSWRVHANALLINSERPYFK